MTVRWGLAALLAIAAPAAATEPASPIAAAPAPSLAAWHGTWVGEGTAFGRAATATLAIEPAAEGGATALIYQLAIPGTPAIAYGAEAIYRVDGKGRVRGSWTDSTGRTRPIGGRLAVSEWVNFWGSADVEIGRSTYVLEAPDRLLASDSVLQDDGSWRVFATLRFRRKP
ncbi:hypothetical protein [Sphingopyxis sp.]|jgi:hypothetical protein|uniref:hypothetical protein n=1 Tax=Sphingopyxis sp. TaxID=1908224 RepID=UPI003F728135